MILVQMRSESVRRPGSTSCMFEDDIRHVVYDDDWEVAEATLNTVTKICKMAEGIQTMEMGCCRPESLGPRR